MRHLIALLAIASMCVQSLPARAQMSSHSIAPAQTPACDAPDRDARILVQMYPTFPDVYVDHLEEGQNIPVDVTVFPDGHVSAMMPKPTGNASVDAVALEAAENSSYSPAIRDCKQVVSAVTAHIFYRRTTESPAACNAPDQDAFMASAPPPVWDRRLTTAGPLTTRVNIAIGANGLVTSATVMRSSGSAALDAVALRDANAADVEPAIRGCKARPDKVVYDVVFDPALPKPDVSCSVPNRAIEAASLIAPNFPNLNNPTFGSAEIQVRVYVTATGTVASTRVMLPSGYAPIDDAAVRAARASKFKPRLVDCIPVPTESVLDYEFYA